LQRSQKKYLFVAGTEKVMVGGEWFSDIAEI